MPGWVHPLDPDEVRFEAGGQRWTLPGFCSLCDSCESLYQAGDDEALVALWVLGSPSAATEWGAREPLQTFKNADLGGRRFADRDPEKGSG